MGLGEQEGEILRKRLATIAHAKTELPFAFDATLKGELVDAVPAARVEGVTSDLAIVAMIGEGGMGRVHLARQRSLDREVAVKTLKEEAPSAIGAALLREARVTGSLEHPGVIPVHALGADESGRPLLVMKRVEGADFGDLLRDEDHPLWSERSSAKSDRLRAKLGILLQVCRTVEFAHARGVIHRDIKPENVMVGRYGEVYLLDWGIAMKKGESDARDVVGTPAYMAPEMFLGGVVDERSDVYLLGATLHFMLTRRFRHEANDLLALATAAVRSAPMAYGPEVPELLADLCNRATARDPNDRPQTAQAFREGIEDFLLRRSAMALSDAARERLSALEAMLAAAGDGVPDDLATAYRLATEARFGFTQSLRERPEHVEAIEGSRAAIVASCELELRQGHADTAEVLLREIAFPDRALLDRVAEVRAKDAARKEEAARLQALERDLDPSVGRASRIAVGAAYASATAVTAVLIASGAFKIGTAWRAVGIQAVFMALVAGVMLSQRRRLVGNAHSRNVAVLVVCLFATTFVDRVACALTGAEVSSALLVDLWIAATTMVAAAIAFERSLWVAAVPLVLGSLGIRLQPERASSWFQGATVAASALFALQVWRRSRSKLVTAAKRSR